jgi:hypothetical protein
MGWPVDRSNDERPPTFNLNFAKNGLGVVKKHLCCEQLPSFSNTESIFCKIQIKGRRPLIIGSVYRPPHFDFDQSKKIIEEIYNISHKNKNAVFWLGGDFNLPDINWKQHTISGNQYPQNINSIFLETAHDLGLTQIVDIPTRGTSILDLFFTNSPDLSRKCNLLAGLGDHEIIEIKSLLYPLRKKPIKRKIHLWNRVDETMGATNFFSES